MPTHPSDSEKLTHDLSDRGLPVLGGREERASSASPLPPSGMGELVVEVELAEEKHARHLVEATSHENVVAAAAPGAAGIDPQLAAVMQRYSLQAVHPAFSPLLGAGAGLSNAAPPGSSAESTAPRRSSLESIVRLHFPAGTPAAEVLDALRGNGSVAKAVRVPDAAPPSAVLSRPPATFDPLVGGARLTTDPATGLDTQWYLHRLNVPHAWSITRAEKTVLIDIDWGCRTSHRELKAGIEYTYNAFDGGADVTRGPYVDHGTAVTSIAGARADGLGMEGFAPAADVWVIQADSGPGPALSPNANHWADAILHATARDSGGRPKVLILEVQTGYPHLGNYEQLPAVHRAVRDAIAAGCIVCVAAGNGDREAHLTDDGVPFEPTGSILVGATSYDPIGNPRASFSNFGPSVVVCAPGDPDHDLSCTAGGDASYRNRFGGTSGATPKVAGVAALMMSANPSLTHQQVREILVSTGVAAGGESGKPIGVMVDADAAVRNAFARAKGVAPGSNVVPIDGGEVVGAQNAEPMAGGTLTADQAWQLAAKAVQAVAQIAPGKEGAIAVGRGAEGTQLLTSRKALLVALDKAADHVVSLLEKTPAQDFMVTTAADVEQALRAAVVRDRLATQTRRLRAMAGEAIDRAAAPFVFTLAAVAQIMPVALSAIAQAGKLLRTDRNVSLFQAGDEALRIFCRKLEAKSDKHRILRLESGATFLAVATDLLRRLETLELALSRISGIAPGDAAPLIQLEVESARKLLAELGPDGNSSAFWNQALGEANFQQMSDCGRIDFQLEGQAVQTVEKRALFGDRIVQSGTVLIDYRITLADGGLVAVGAEIFESRWL